MTRFKAIFLDRDGTLSTRCPVMAAERDREIERITGHQGFALTPEANDRIFWSVMNDPSVERVVTVAREETFWRKWYQCILEENGLTTGVEAQAARLYERFCFHQMMKLYPETRNVLERLKSAGFLMGVISDTFPSLQLSIEALGIAHYFDSFTASSLVGVGKPDPRIFRAALDSLGVEPEESVFVDDCLVEADGAREQGFTSFNIRRELVEADFARWTIGDLRHLADYLGV